MKNELLDLDENGNEDPNGEDVISEKVPVAMSNDMIKIDDEEHSWDFNNFKWENIGKDTWRAKVKNGWVLKCVDQREIYYVNFNQIGISTTMEFIPDQTHEWKIVKQYTKFRKPNENNQ